MFDNEKHFNSCPNKNNDRTGLGPAAWCFMSCYCIVIDVRLVVIRNVFGTCSDKTDPDGGININNLVLESYKLIPHWSHQMYFSNNSFYDQCYLFFSPMRCLSNTLFLSLSAILLSSPLFPFYIKMLSDGFRISLNKQILIRTVLISKGTSIWKYCRPHRL